MLRYERLNAVLDMVARRGRVSVEEVVEAFSLSPATVRRDLDELAAQQLVIRTRGGAVAQALTYDLPLRYKHVRRPTEKRRIAAAAADLVSPGMVIALNGGTTNSEVARSIAMRTELTEAAQESNGISLTVVTNALNIANELTVRPHIKNVVLGGVSRPQSYELVGSLSTPVLATLTIDLMFLAVDAFDPAAGAACVHEEEAVVNRAMVERSERVVVVADSSKLGRRAFCTICPTASVRDLVTDTGAAATVVDEFTAAGVEVRLV